MSARQREPTSVYVLTTALGLLAAGLFALSRGVTSQAAWHDVLLFIALAAVAENWSVSISSSSLMSLSFTVYLAAGILFGPATAAIVAVCAVVITDGAIRRCAPVKVSFNVCQMAIATMLASMTYILLGGSPALSLLDDALPVALASLVFLLANNTLVSLVLGLTGRSFAQEWLESSRDILLP